MIFMGSSVGSCTSYLDCVIDQTSSEKNRMCIANIIS